MLACAENGSAPRRSLRRPLSFPRDSISTHTLCLFFAITGRIYRGVHRLCREPRRVAYYVLRAALSIDVRALALALGLALALAARQLPGEFTVANAPISVPPLLGLHYPWTADWFRSRSRNDNNGELFHHEKIKSPSPRHVGKSRTSTTRVPLSPSVSPPWLFFADETVPKRGDSIARLIATSSAVFCVNEREPRVDSYFCEFQSTERGINAPC